MARTNIENLYEVSRHLLREEEGDFPMADLPEKKIPIHQLPALEPVASDGSKLTVVRDSYGQVSEASGTGHDGVARRYTVKRTIATNPAGFHFITTHLAFFEERADYLRIETTFSPDAAMSSFEASSGTSHFGSTITLSPVKGVATVVTTTGSHAIVELSHVSLLRERTPVLPTSVSGSLAPPQAILDALEKTGYFQPLFEQENKQQNANLEAALQAVNLNIHMPTTEILSRLSPSMSPPGMSKPTKSAWKALIWGTAAILAAVVAVLAAPPVVIVLVAGVSAADASLLSDYVDSLPAPPAAPKGDETPPASSDDGGAGEADGGGAGNGDGSMSDGSVGEGGGDGGNSGDGGGGGGGGDNRPQQVKPRTGQTG